MNEINKAIIKQEYVLKKSLKDDQRSKVLLIELNGKEYVYKIPIEKNKRVWQRILSFFRGSESKREYKNYVKIIENGFKGPIPVTYYEKKKFGIVLDSFLVTEFLSGKEANIENLEKVAKELEKIHNAGYLHGDSQLANFMIFKDEVYLIDAKLSKNIYGDIGSKYEFIYLEESCHREINIYDKKTLSYKIAKSFNLYLHWYGRVKKKLRGKDN